MRKIKFLTYFAIFIAVFAAGYAKPKTALATGICGGYINCCYGEPYCCDPPLCLTECVTDSQVSCGGCGTAEDLCLDIYPVTLCEQDGGHPCTGEAPEPGEGPGCLWNPDYVCGAATPTSPPGATGTPTPTTRPPGNAGVRIRIMYDANKNTAIDDGDANFVEDPDIRSCDNLAPNYTIFKDIDSATIDIENGGWILNHPTQCYPAGGADDPKYPWSIKSLSGLGTYSFSFSIPGYKLVNATANKCTVTSDTTATCDLSAGTQELTFLITDLTPTCEITSGQDKVSTGKSYTYTVESTDPSGDLSKTELYKSPYATPTWSPVFDNCTTASCIGSTSFSSPGQYYLTCNAYDLAGNKCSGNPWCSGWDPVRTPEATCAGFSDCAPGTSNENNLPDDVFVVEANGLPTCAISETGGFASGGTIGIGTTLNFVSTVTLDPANFTKDPDIRQYTNTSQTFTGATLLSSNSACPVGNTTCQTTKTYTFNQPGTFYAFCNGFNDAVGECRPFDNTPETADCGPSDIIVVNVAQSAGNIQARASLVSPTDGCAAVASSTTYLDGTVFGLSPTVTPATQTQTGGAPVLWSNISPDTYTLSAESPSGNYALNRACYSKTGVAPWSEGLAAALGQDETITWNLGFITPGPWVQTQGGDVYAKTTITSLVPVDASPRYFNLDGSGGYPGVVIYGGSGSHPYDFDIGAGYGEDLVSSKGWLVNDVFDEKDFYTLFYHKFGAPTTPDTFPDLNNVGKPDSRSTPYYVVGDMTTSGNWTINNGQNIVFLIDGNLTIKGKINLVPPGNGFIAFIVKGNITIDSKVGGPPSSRNSTLEGIYVAGGSLNTSLGENGKERLVGQGIFIANSFSRERNLGDAGGNKLISAELYIYNPRLLLTMPAQMKDVSIIWEEVAP